MKYCMLTNEDKNQILISFLETIEGISNKNYQERVWIRGEGPEIDDYTESVCHFFDAGEQIISQYKDYEITDRQLSLLITLRDAIIDFNSNIRFGLGPDFIYSTKWSKITFIAKEVLNAFDYK